MRVQNSQFSSIYRQSDRIFDLNRMSLYIICEYDISKLEINELVEK